MTTLKDKTTPPIQSMEERNEIRRDFIKALSQIPEIKDLPMQRSTVSFPVVSEEERRIAYEAYYEFVEKYGLTIEDTDAITKALMIIWSASLSRTCGEIELSCEEDAFKVKWQ